VSVCVFVLCFLRTERGLDFRCVLRIVTRMRGTSFCVFLFCLLLCCSLEIFLSFCLVSRLIRFFLCVSMCLSVCFVSGF
jgi:hypothetical protein